MSMRYAVYYAPTPGTPWADFGARWLGRDSDSGRDCDPPDLLHVTPVLWDRAVSAPRVYGFHGTLKPPFRLRRESSETAFFAAIETLASRTPPVTLGKLRIAELGGFIALVPEQAAGVSALAAHCVEQLDDFRTPPSPGALARRRAGGLTPSQDLLLRRWGYPYVMEEFRFHLTLTGRLDKEARASFHRELADRTAALTDRTARIADLAIFVQTEPGAPFLVKQRFPLTAAAK